jgi:heat shock protein HtpX
MIFRRLRSRCPPGADTPAGMNRLRRHIRSNAVTTVLLLAALFVLTVPMAFGLVLFVAALLSLAGPQDVTIAGLLEHARTTVASALPFLAAGTAAWLVCGVLRMRSIVARVTGAMEIAPEERPALHAAMEKLAASAGEPSPRLFILASAVPNAFTCGMRRGDHSVTVTEGLLDLLDGEETEAVLAQQLAHIRNGDTVLVGLASVIAGWPAFWGDVLLGRFDDLLHNARFAAEEPKFLVVTKALLIGGLLAKAAGWAALPLRFALSRNRLMAADAGAVELTGNPDALIRALKKLDAVGEPLPDVPVAVRDMCFFDPVRTRRQRLLSTHPPLAERVEALVRYAGGRRPDPA